MATVSELLAKWRGHYGRGETEQAERTELRIRRMLTNSDPNTRNLAETTFERVKAEVAEYQRQLDRREFMAQLAARPRTPSVRNARAENDRITAIRRKHEQLVSASKVGNTKTRPGTTFKVEAIEADDKSAAKKLGRDIVEHFGATSARTVLAGMAEELGRGVRPAGYVAKREFSVLLDGTMAEKQALGSQLAQTYGPHSSVISEAATRAIQEERQRRQLLDWSKMINVEDADQNPLIKQAESEVAETRQKLADEADEREQDFQRRQMMENPEFQQAQV